MLHNYVCNVISRDISVEYHLYYSCPIQLFYQSTYFYLNKIFVTYWYYK
jgi:hypothetical protein